jgi:4-hydroxy-3-methylbut-2-enyl diphosphate reductase IspH
MEKVISGGAARVFAQGSPMRLRVVELALKAFGTPLYVRHAIVHNEHVVRSFERRGVVFVEDLAAVPPGATRGLQRAWGFRLLCVSRRRNAACESSTPPARW